MIRQTLKDHLTQHYAGQSLAPGTAHRLRTLTEVDRNGLPCRDPEFHADRWWPRLSALAAALDALEARGHEAVVAGAEGVLAVGEADALSRAVLARAGPLSRRGGTGGNGGERHGREDDLGEPWSRGGHTRDRSTPERLDRESGVPRPPPVPRFARRSR